MPRMPLDYILTTDFAAKNIAYKLYYANTSVMIVRLRYYLGFTLADLGAVACGIAYSGKNKHDKHTWNRAKNSNAEYVELTHDLNSKIVNWNMSV